MQTSANIRTFLKKPQLLICYLVAAGYLILAVFFLPDYLEFNIALFTGLAFAPYIFIVRDIKTSGYKYFWIALFIITISFFINIRTLYFISLVFAVLFLIESILGKLNHLPIILLILLCPIFPYFSSFIGIPARLKLTEFAGDILKLVNFDISVMGNIIFIKGEEFSVDPACMGLNMMSISFLLGMFVIAYYERNTGKRLSLPITSFCLLLIFLLNIICNLIRILVLVIFHIVPENLFHDIIGIVCLILYVVLPFIVIVKFIYHCTSLEIEKKTTGVHLSKNIVVMNLLLICLIAYKSLNLKNDVIKQNLLPSICHIDQYKKEIVNNHVIKFEKKNALIYVKPVNSFYGAEHTPMICWTGSGYEFQNIHKRTINNTEIYTGILKKGKDIIYTAWWFDNGVFKTIDQFDWRWRVMKGEDEFSLINVNSVNEIYLMSEINKILNKNIFI